MIVQLKNVSKQYKDANFKLENISFDINKKEVIGIIGRNGTGKSTILKMINGIVSYDSGDILYKNYSIKNKDASTIRNTRKNLARLKNSLCGSLSGGEQQKVAIAMALLQEPEVLLCDEISSALDTNSEKEIFALLNKLRTTTDISIVMISHSLSLLKNFCDRVVVIDDSTIKDIVVPNKNAKDDYDSNYYNYVKEFLLNDWFI